MTSTPAREGFMTRLKGYDRAVSREIATALAPERIEVSPKFRSMLDYMLGHPWDIDDPITAMARGEQYELLYSLRAHEPWRLECREEDLVRNITGVSIVAGLGEMEFWWLLARIPQGRLSPVLLAIIVLFQLILAHVTLSKVPEIQLSPPVVWEHHQIPVV